jgi:hypothetical protein
MAILELQNRKVELEKLLNQAEASMKQAKEDGNIPKYLGYAKSWFTILENISETQREINKINYQNLVLNNKK